MNVKPLQCLLLLVLMATATSGRADDYELRRQYDVYFLEAMMQRQEGHHGAAFDLLQRCIALRPDASEAYFLLAGYYDSMDDRPQALSYLQRADQLQPGNATYMETLAQAYAQAGSYAEAIGVAERLYEADKSRQDMLELLYQLYIEEKAFDKAIGVLNRMETIDGKSERLSLAKASLYIQQDDKEAALQEVKALSEQYPNDLNYRTLYANTLMMRQASMPDDEVEAQRRQAHDVLQDILREEPDNYRAQVALRTYYLTRMDTLRADSLTRSILLNAHTQTDDKVNLLRQEIAHSEEHGGDSTRVLALFRDMLAQPKPEAAMAEFCAAYMNLKKMPRDSVESMLKLALQLAPDNASARLQLVQYAWSDNDDQRVISLCKDARQYNPDEMAFYYYQGMAYYRQDDYRQSLEAFQNGISVITEESNAEIVSDFYAVMGDLLHRDGRAQEAFAAYDSCLQWNDKNIGCLNNYAYYLSELGQQLDRAEEMSYKAIKAEPKNATYLDTYAWIMFMQGRYAEARIYIDQALQNDSVPGGVVLEHAGDIYFHVGLPDEALGFWQQALPDQPQNKVLVKKIKRKKYIKPSK